MKNVLLAVLAAISIGLVGCDQLKNLASGKDAFLSGFEGRWSIGENGLNFSVVDGKLVGIADDASLFVVAPTGKLDETNEIIPARLEIHSKPSYQQASLKIIPKVSGNDLIAASLTFTLALTPASDKKDLSAKIIAGLIGSMRDREKSDAQNLEALKAKFMAIKKTDLVEINFVNGALIDPSPNNNVTNLAFRADNGTTMGFNFVRALNESEKKQLVGYQKIVDENASIAGEAYDNLIAAIDKIIAANDKKMKAEKSTSQDASVTEQVAQPRQGDVSNEKAGGESERTGAESENKM